MSEEILDLLRQWKNSNKLGKRNYEKSDSQIRENEYKIILNISILLNEMNINLTKIFETYAQSSNDILINKKGDVNRLNTIINDLETEFLNEYEIRAKGIR